MSVNRTLPHARVAASVAAGTIALIVLGLQPLLYAAYVLEGTIAAQRLGLLAAVELAGIAGGSAIGVHLLERWRPQALAVGGILLLSTGNFLPIAIGQTALLFLARGIAGAGAGLLVGVAATAIARTQRMGAWSGAFLFGQALSQYGVMRGFELFHPQPTSMEVQHVLGWTTVAAIVLVPMLPLRLAYAAAPGATPPGRPEGRGLLGLIAILLCVGGAGGFWAYLDVWMQSRGVPRVDSASLLSTSLLGQIIGAAIGAAIADGRWSWVRLLLILSVLLSAVLAWMIWPASQLVAFSFGAAFMLGAPAFISVLGRLDPLHRATPFSATAQLAGLAIVPTIAGETLAAHDLTLVLLACFASIAIGFLLFLAQIPWLLKTATSHQPSSGALC